MTCALGGFYGIVVCLFGAFNVVGTDCGTEKGAAGIAVGCSFKWGFFKGVLFEEWLGVFRTVHFLSLFSLIVLPVLLARFRFGSGFWERPEAGWRFRL